MRSLALLALAAALLAVPTSAAEANGVHLSWVGDGYDVAFSSTQPLASSVATWTTASGRTGSSPLQPTTHVPGDSDTVYWAHLPADAASYQVEGRTFDIRGPAPSSRDTIRVAFVADWGRSNDSWDVLDAIVAQKPDLLIVGGDLSYANGVSSKWDEWLRHLEPLGSTIPVMVAMGNHEALCADATGGLAPCAREPQEFDEHMRMPQPSGAPPHTYSFDWGPARFLALNTEDYHVEETNVATEQDAQAQADYARSALASAPPDAWRIAFLHRSLYSSNAGDGGSDTVARDALLPLLQSGGVSLVLSGHVHAYERTYQLRDGRVVERGPTFSPFSGIVFVDSGGGGRSLYSDWSATPAWSATHDADFEFTMLTISPNRIEEKAMTPDGRVLDSFVIDRDAKVQEVTSHGVPSAGVLAVVVVAALLTLSARRKGPRAPR